MTNIKPVRKSNNENKCFSLLVLLVHQVQEQNYKHDIKLNYMSTRILRDIKLTLISTICFEKLTTIIKIQKCEFLNLLTFSNIVGSLFHKLYTRNVYSLRKN